MQYDNTNSGMLRKNQTKQKDSHPDYRGKINVGGVEYWISAWIKVGREGTKLAGEKYMSLSVQPIEESQPQPRPGRYPARRAAPERPQPERRREDDEFGRDEIPF
jgi:hypothetical protein